jgi:hypothetical protein
MSLDIRDKVLVTLSFVDNKLEANNGVLSLSDGAFKCAILIQFYLVFPCLYNYFSSITMAL